MNRNNFVSLCAVFSLFCIGTVLAIVGTATIYWMTGKVHVFQGSQYASGKVEVGLFRYCSSLHLSGYASIEQCQDLSTEEVEGLNAKNSDFVACRLFAICGDILGVCTLIACGIFIRCVTRALGAYNKGSFIATMVCSIPSAICFLLTVILFESNIHSDAPEVYDLDHSFILTCIGAAFMCLGFIAFPFIARSARHLNHQETPANAGVVYVTNPQHPGGIQMAFPQPAVMQVGHPQQMGMPMANSQQQGMQPSSPSKTEMGWNDANPQIPPSYYSVPQQAP